MTDMKLSQFKYRLPAERIALHPVSGFCLLILPIIQANQLPLFLLVLLKMLGFEIYNKCFRMIL